MNLINSIIYKYLLVDYKSISTNELRALSISIFIFLESIIVGIIFTPIQIYAGGWILFSYVISLILIGMTSICLIRIPKYRTASRIFYLLACNLLIYLNAKSIGLDGGLQYFFAITCSLPFLMFGSKTNKRIIQFSLSLPFVFGVLLYLIDYSVVDFITVKPIVLFYYNFVSGALSLWMVSFSIYYFYQTVLDRDALIEMKDKTIYESDKLASLGILSSGIAHEINNPLAVIVGTTAQLKRNLLDGQFLTNEPEVKLERIQKMTTRIEKIIKSLTVYNQNDKDIPLAKISIIKLIEEAVVLFGKNLEIHNINFSYPRSSNIDVLGRESDLLQVFINLFQNSIDEIKMKEGPKWIKISFSSEGKKVKILFQDSGDGVPLTIQNSIFDPFFTTKSIGEGTGLGLHISRNLLLAMDGNLEYLGNMTNATFLITLHLPQYKIIPNFPVKF